MDIGSVTRRDEEWPRQETSVQASKPRQLPFDVQERDAHDAVLFAPQPGDSHLTSAYDLQQRLLGDCYFHATLGALTTKQAGRDLLEHGIREDKDPGGHVVSYTVTFHEKIGAGFHPTQVVVPASKLPVVEIVKTKNGISTTSWGIPSDTRATTDGKREMWAAVYEHAFILYRGGAARSQGGLPVTVMELLTGKSAERHTMPVENDPRPGVIDYTPRNLAADIKANKIVVANTRDRAVLDPALKLVGRHSYVVTGVIDDGGVWKVQLHNPHGDLSKKDEKDVTIPFSAWRRSFDSFDVGSP